MLKIGIIGVGKFGQEHLKECLHLQSLDELHVSFLAVETENHAQALSNIYGIPAYTSISDEQLANVDGVIICTPAETHLQLIKQCLPHCHVLVEKPMVHNLQALETVEQIAGDYPNQLMIGHNYRFLPIIQALKSILDQENEAPQQVKITLLNTLPETPHSKSHANENPSVNGNGSRNSLDPNLEFIHAFDLMQYFFNCPITWNQTQTFGLQNDVSLVYDERVSARFSLGFQAGPTRRSITLIYTNKTIHCDLVKHTIKVQSGTTLNTKSFSHEPVALREQTRAFLKTLRDHDKNPMTASTAAKATKAALKTMPKKIKRKPKVAVIGAGIFGANVALSLDAFCDVDLFEQHDDIMTEVSYLNQWRHHSGFHYPRSYDTIQEIRTCKSAFENIYEHAITRSVPSYFCPSATGIEIPAARYVSACASNYLSFSFEYPLDGVLNREAVSVALKTDEAVYDYEALKRITRTRLDASNINLRLNTAITNARLSELSTKKLEYATTTQTSSGSETYDYVINTTYSNRNLLAHWLDLPIERLRFDLYEMLLLRLPIDPICLTIIDGPFTSLVGLGYDNLFLLSHIHDSVLRSEVPENGLPPSWPAHKSNRINMLNSAKHYFPIIEAADVVESRFAMRAVSADAKDFDARPTVVQDHGFGCWSVLGGKILTCVSNAEEIAEKIRKNT